VISCNAASVPARLGRIVLAILCLASFSLLRVVAEPPAPDSKRFLFIIDTSASMKPFEKAASETLFDLIYSGARGHMTNGDTYGVWLVNDQNNTTFKMETWKQKYAVEIAAKAVKYVKDNGFKGRARLSLAIADAAAVIRNVEDLTVILISNGEMPVTGTPFDDIINLRLRELGPHMKRAKATVNLAMVAQEGRIVAWAANTPEFLIEIPNVPPRPPRQKLAAETPNNSTNTTNVVLSSVLVTNEPPKPRIALNPIIITRDSVAQERRNWQSKTTTTAAQEPESTTTNATNSVATSSVDVTNAPASTRLSSTGPASNAFSAAVPSSSTNSGVAATTSSTEARENIAVSPTEAAPVSVSAPTDQSTVGTSWTPILWAGIGAAVAIGCLLGGFFMARARRHEPSLISQSLANERVRAT
jgi:hypothetical protein